MLKYLTIFFFLFSSTIFSQNSSIKLEINGIKNSKGFVTIALYNNSLKFMKNELKKIKIKPKIGKINAYINQIPSGTYAIAVLHDENNNNKMDFNFIGIPAEPYGFSNNPRIILKAPNFKDVSFSLKPNESKSMKIFLK